MARKRRRKWGASVLPTHSPSQLPQGMGIESDEISLPSGDKMTLHWRQRKTHNDLDESLITYRSSGHSVTLRLAHHSQPKALRQVFSLEFPPQAIGRSSAFILRIAYQETSEERGQIQAGPYKVAVNPSKGTILSISLANEHARFPTPPITPTDGEAGLLAAICSAVLKRPRSFF